MNETKVKTKNGGTIIVKVFEKIEEYVEAYGKEKTLTDLNRMNRIDAVNNANRKMSLPARLKVAVREGKVTEAQLLALLK